MNFPRYKFDKESEPELLKFLKAAKNAPQKNCDLRKYEMWNKLFPPDPILLEKIDNCRNENVIVIEDSDEGILEGKPNAHNSDTKMDEFKENNKCSISDIAFAIKENLKTMNELSQSSIENIINCLGSEQEELFMALNQTLNNEEILYLGKSLQVFASNELITMFCHAILLPQMQREYSEDLSRLLQNICNSTYSSSCNKAILSKLLEINDDDNIFLQYLYNIQPNCQSVILRDFVFSIETLSKPQLLIIETLLNKQVEYGALNKLVEMLSNMAEDHVNDKAFGKLLMNVIQCLGTNVLSLEQSLKHIIAGHKSIWKSKLEKTFNTHYDDTLMFSQTFRD